MALGGGLFFLLGLLVSFGHQSASQRAIALFILVLGAVGGIRSQFAYEARLAPNELLLKSFYTTRRMAYSSIQMAKRSSGQVLLYERAYLELIMTDDTSVQFKALNERLEGQDLVARAVAAINYRIAQTTTDKPTSRGAG